MIRRSPRRFAIAIGALLALAAVPPPAGADLPRTYTVQRVDSPSPVANGRFGLGLVNVGDVNGDTVADLLTGTDKHGSVLGQNQVAVISGATGAILRTYALPDVDAGGGGDRPSGFGAAVTPLPDIGACSDVPAPAPGNPCASVSATGDGIAEHLVSASGVDLDVATGAPNAALNNSLGVVYVFDGATGALVKRLIMPAADRTEQTTGVTSGDPRYGRSLLSPGDLVGAGGALGTDGKADILVGVTDYNETQATAHASSPCADAGNTEPCRAAGRVYLYSGADVLAGGSGTSLALPTQTIKNPHSLPDDPTPISPFVNSEGFGTLLTPIGDSGQCTSAAPAEPGGECATKSNNADGKPEFAAAEPGFDILGMEEVGAVTIIDGAKLSSLKHVEYPDPRPEASWGQAQNGTVFPAVGDIGQSSHPDLYMPDIQWNGSHTAEGRGIAVDARPSTRGSFREFFSRFSDPTPSNGEQFGLSATPIGDVDGSADTRNELLIGGIGPHNPGTNANVITDVHIFNPITEEALQTIPAPDQQGGESFGISVAALGDTNGDGFRDFAAGAGFYDLATAGPPCATPCTSSGRVYILTSDDSPAPVTPPAPLPRGPAGPAGPAGPGAPALVVAGRSLELEASRRRVRRGSRIRLRGLLEAFANEESCEPRQRVSLQRRRPGRLRYRTFKRVLTNSRGAFSVRTRVRRSYVYRARVARTGQCTGAASAPERVTALRRRR